MELRSTVVMALVLFGCGVDVHEEDAESEASEEVEGVGDGDAYNDVPENRGGNSGGVESFDPCPEDSYVLLEEPDGTRYIIRIPVFCEPLTDIYLGCPAPF